MTTKKNLSTEKKIVKELTRLKGIFKHLPKDTQATAMSLLRNAAFMTVTLDDLAETITRDGVVSEYQNGENQWGTKKSPEVDIYNVMIKNHLSVIRQLCDLFPDDKAKGVADELMDFVKKRSR